jgi:hypothetical protein
VPPIELRFPSGGLDRRLSYANQAPTTTPYSLNVWPDDVTLDRARGGTRPGIEKFLLPSVGGMPDLVADVTYVSGGVHRSKIVVVYNGLLYYDDNAGNLTTVNTPGATLATGYQLGYAELYQKLYIIGDNSGDSILCVYDPATNTLDQVAGLVAGVDGYPPDCTMACNYNNRIILAGNPASPQSYYASRQGDPTDWIVGVVGDTQAPFSAVNSDQGRLGEKITALIPHNNDCMFFGCTSSMYAMQGDIQSGGRITKLCENIGVWGPRSWCYDTDGVLYFLSYDGLYVMAPGCGSMPKAVSRPKIPQELINIDRDAYRVSMAYDTRNRGVLIAVTSITGADTSTMFFVSTENNVAFWPVEFANPDHHAGELFALRERIPTTQGRGGLVIGSRDGYIRRFNRDLSQDDDYTDIEAAIDLGPFPLGEDATREGIIQKVQVALGTGAGSVECAVRASKSAQQAYESEAFFTASLNQEGLNRTFYPRVRGQSGLVRISNVDGSSFSLEQVTVNARDFGERRA